MKRRSSTSASSPGRFLAAFFGIGLVVLWGANLALLEAYRWRRYRSPSSEYVEKMRNARDAFRRGCPIEAVFAGDSTVSVGIMPRVLGPGYLNVAWSGFEPSELSVLERDLLAVPVPPKRVFIGVNPTYLSQNEWRNPFSVPPGAALLDGIRSFYDDTNSLRPLAVMGGLAALAGRFLVSPLDASPSGREGIVTRLTVEPDGLLVVEPEMRRGVPPRGEWRLHFRRVNFELLERFRRDLARRGVGTTWIFMPYAPAQEQAFRDGGPAGGFFLRYREEIGRIFGDDVVDLRGSIPGDLFRDEGHLTREGAQVLTQELGARLALPRQRGGPGCAGYSARYTGK